MVHFYDFSEQLYSDQKATRQDGQIKEGIMTARSPRLSDIATKVSRNEATGYKRIQRFLQDNDPQRALKLLINEEADFVVGNPIGIERPHSHRTSYVGTLMDGETKGFWIMKSLPFNREYMIGKMK